MAEKNVSEVFLEAVKDQEFVKALTEAGTADEGLAVLKTKGITMPAEEVDAFLDQFSALAEESLEGVAGGIGDVITQGGVINQTKVSERTKIVINDNSNNPYIDLSENFKMLSLL